jgi:3-methyl-2-oxobutanoate hydroxymethyltransferase
VNDIKKKSILDIIGMKGKEKISSLTAYDYQIASMLDRSGIDIVLVGDSLGNVVLGYENTLPVTMEDMIHHTKAVARGVKNALLVADMPFKSFQGSVDKTVENACALVQAGAQAVKLEGGIEICDRISRLVRLGIPVMGHVGLTPQSINQLGIYSIQGKDDKTAKRLLDDARSVEEAGAFSIVLECIEPKLTGEITKSIKIPTIGIGSGSDCDGQILVINDLIGLSVTPVPKFVKPLLNLKGMIEETVVKYINQTKKQ